MGQEPNKEGRPETTKEEMDIILQKLEPYLKSGLSIRKSLLEAQIANSTFYNLMDKFPEFAEQIHRFRNFVSVLANNSVVRQLQGIIKKQNDNIKLDKEELAFLQWFVTNSNLTKEEFGERKDVTLYDPEAEIHKIAKMIDEVAGEESNEK